MYGGQLQFSPTLSVTSTDEINLINTGKTDNDFKYDEPASILTHDVLKYEEEQFDELRNK